MVNRYCRNLLNRCIGLMRANIQKVHIVHRGQSQQPAVATSLTVEKRNKYRSTWEHEEVNHRRTVDYSASQSNASGDRSYDGTWVNFPTGRRSFINRPSTAKPCNDKAKAFLRQWANQND
uniref:GA19111 n=1 Tax=Drosophila pseudoobscura TaxID=7237 RepID=Q5I3G9_9MUSC|nr:GA19111 [Drosophila pseudoobscura]